MARFPGVDYLLIDSQFSEQERMVRATTRQFVDDQIVPIIKDHFRQGTFPKHLIPEMGRLGFLRTMNDDYFSRGLGLAVQDLHDENVLVDVEDNLVFLDPMIVLTRRYELAGFEFNSAPR